MSPTCLHCGSRFKGKHFKGTEGDTVSCPSCGQDMEVHYTFGDSVEDADCWCSGNLRSLRYVPRKRLVIYLLIALAILVAGIMMGAFG